MGSCFSSLPNVASSSFPFPSTTLAPTSSASQVEPMTRDQASPAQHGLVDSPAESEDEGASPVESEDEIVSETETVTHPPVAPVSEDETPAPPPAAPISIVSEQPTDVVPAAEPVTAADPNELRWREITIRLRWSSVAVATLIAILSLLLTPRFPDSNMYDNRHDEKTEHVRKIPTIEYILAPTALSLYAMALLGLPFCYRTRQIRLPRWMKCIADTIFLGIAVMLAGYVKNGWVLAAVYIANIHLMALANVLVVFENIGALDCGFAVSMEATLHVSKNNEKVSMFVVAVLCGVCQIMKHCNELYKEETLNRLDAQRRGVEYREVGCFDYVRGEWLGCVGYVRGRWDVVRGYLLDEAVPTELEMWLGCVGYVRGRWDAVRGYFLDEAVPTELEMQTQIETGVDIV